MFTHLFLLFLQFYSLTTDFLSSSKLYAFTSWKNCPESYKYICWERKILAVYSSASSPSLRKTLRRQPGLQHSWWAHFDDVKIHSVAFPKTPVSPWQAHGKLVPSRAILTIFLNEMLPLAMWCHERPILSLPKHSHNFRLCPIHHIIFP